MPETAKRRANEAAADSSAGATKKVKGAGPAGLCVTPATAGIHGCAALPGDVLMPWVGLGTYKVRSHRAVRHWVIVLWQRTHTFPITAQFKDPKDAQRSIGDALELGYRAIDTAFIYNNQKTEKAVGA
jgi:hypothetical protein